ncbi:hypothetical protein [Parahaliea mediterranea]|uniref:Sulfotransferase family protein n=1 Tax=Parahaliea mediterranea TaxID=651086 RepID=A0A939IKQ8_9GAMM|nr:hypothetical protein [Parahaliea mediterranea]MBN7795183.1 hypothetical protein [Parahaliea mediterranea]
MSQPEIAFLHIPKTAGTSQHQSFNRWYGREQIFWFGDDCPADVATFPREALGSRQVIGGHKPLGFYPGDFDPLFCAVLREPIERAVSLFAYYTRPDLAGQPGEKAARERALSRSREVGMVPDDLLASLKRSRQFRAEVSNVQCGYLSRRAATFAGVLRTLGKRDAVVGTLNEYPRFQQRLSDLLDWPVATVGSANRSRANYLDEYLDDKELVALLRELNGEDRKLLDHVNGEHGGLWVNLRDEARRRERLQAIPTRRFALTQAEARKAGLWPRRDNHLPWPARNYLALPGRRQLFVPVPGGASMLVVDLLAATLPIVDKQRLPTQNLYPWMVRFNLGQMLKDWPAADAQAYLGRGDVSGAALIQDPVSRLLGVYLKHLVREPESLRGQMLFLDSLAAVQGKEHPDLALGMTFRQFVENIRATPVERLGLARAPQSHFLASLWPGNEALFSTRSLPALMDFLGIPESVRQLHNQRIEVLSREEPVPAPLGDLADAMPEELRAIPQIDPARLLDAGLEASLREYYAEDDALYRRAASTSSEPAKRVHRA